MATTDFSALAIASTMRRFQGCRGGDARRFLRDGGESPAGR